MNIESIQNFENNFNQIMGVKNVQSESPDVSKFGEVLKESLESMKSAQESAKVDMADVLMGNSDNAYEAMISKEKIGLQMEFANSIKEKAVQGINQMLNMQV